MDNKVYTLVRDEKRILPSKLGSDDLERMINLTNQLLYNPNFRGSFKNLYDYCADLLNKNPLYVKSLFSKCMMYKGTGSLNDNENQVAFVKIKTDFKPKYRSPIELDMKFYDPNLDSYVVIMKPQFHFFEIPDFDTGLRHGNLIDKTKTTLSIEPGKLEIYVNEVLKVDHMYGN
jgi:hypothetical protein